MPDSAEPKFASSRERTYALALIREFVKDQYGFQLKGKKAAVLKAVEGWTTDVAARALIQLRRQTQARLELGAGVRRTLNGRRSFRSVDCAPGFLSYVDQKLGESTSRLARTAGPPLSKESLRQLVEFYYSL